jgi:hypothetical protein
MGTRAMYNALKSCADILTHGWDMDQYCHHAGWKEVMTVWKERKIQATIREFDDEGLAIREAIQVVRDGMHDRDSQMGACLLSSPQPGVFLHLLLRYP